MKQVAGTLQSAAHVFLATPDRQTEFTVTSQDVGRCLKRRRPSSHFQHALFEKLFGSPESPRCHCKVRVFPDIQALATQSREVVWSRPSGVGFTATAERCRCDQLFKRSYGHDWSKGGALLAYDEPPQHTEGEQEGHPFAIRRARAPSRTGRHWPRPRCATNIRIGVSPRDEGEQAKQVEAI